MFFNWFNEYDGGGVTRTTNVDLVLDISYRLKRLTHTKEQCAILINGIVQSACDNARFVVGKKDEKTLREIKDIVRMITPTIQGDTDSVIKCVNYFELRNAMRYN